MRYRLQLSMGSLFFILFSFLLIDAASAQARGARGASRDSVRAEPREARMPAAEREKSAVPGRSSNGGADEKDAVKTRDLPARASSRGSREAPASGGRQAQETAKSPGRSAAAGRADRTDDADRVETRRSTGSARRAQPPVYAPPNVYGPPAVQARPQDYRRYDPLWPWEYRAREKWAPMYEFRQTVYVEDPYGRRRYRDRLEVVTRYRQRVRRADRRRAEVELDVEAITLHLNGRYLGQVRNIPDAISRVRGTLYERGGVDLDRDLFLVGSPDAGFELISTQHYDNYILGSYRSGHSLRVGALDLRRERVKAVRRSRLFDPSGREKFMPIPLLPRSSGSLFDYGRESLSWQDRDDWDPYRDIDRDRGRVDDYEYGRVRQDRSRASRAESDPARDDEGVSGMRATDRPRGSVRAEEVDEVPSDGGGTMRQRRETELRRVE